MEISLKIRNQQSIHLLAEIFFSDQRATVCTDTESEEFKIERESKQGDASSSLLSNSVLQFAIEGDLKTWRWKGVVIKL